MENVWVASTPCFAPGMLVESVGGRLSVDDIAFFMRAILASSAGPDDEDAVRQLRELFSPDEFAAWQAYRAAALPVVVRAEHDDERDRYVVEWGRFGIQGQSEQSYEAAIRDLAGHVQAWASELRDGSRSMGTTPELSALVTELDALSDDELCTYLLVRVCFDRGELTFGLAEFVEEDGSTSQRAVPFDDGRPPAEVDVQVDGRVTTYQASVRGDRVSFSPVGAGPSLGDTLRQEEPTGDVDAEFPQADFRPDR